MRFVISDLYSRLQFSKSIVFLLTVWLGSINYYSIDAARNEIRCGSIDIRNSPYFGSSGFKTATSNELDCTIVEGDFTLSMITEEGISDEMFPVFKNLREITGAILVFQIKGLSSLGKIFPNLRVIGGYSLIMNYALVIYQNQDLRNVGLTKLSVIKNGGVRIAENSRLCYTRNINWENMIVGNLRDVILDTVESQCQDQCIVADEDRCYKTKPGVISCWNATECQTHCQHYKLDNGDFGPGCTDTGEICHPYCLGGCTKANDSGACHTCQKVEINGVCEDTCPPNLYEQMGRRCLTKEQCHSLSPVPNTLSTTEAAWKAFNGKCRYDCPVGYEEDPKDNRNCIKCIGHCPKKCKGDENIDSAGAALKFKECNIIDGYLEIEIRIGNEVNAEKFSEAFGQLEEITGYLMIRFSSVFVSLHMFKNLRVIHGNQLWRGNYALIVFDNQNLRELFNLKKQGLTISKGKVQFQNNRMLCYKKIETFLDHIGMLKDVTDIDVSTYSNGEKAVCDELPLEVEVTFVYSDGFSIRWTPFNTTDLDYRKFIGYQIYYKKVDRVDEDLSIDEDRSACADTWKMQFSEAATPEENEDASKSRTGGELINGIEANTIYAFYVQTRIVNHPGARNAISKINFVKTHFGNPDPPRIKVYRARGPDRIEMQWDPPLSPQGIITHYTVQWQPPEQPDHFEDLNGCSDDMHKPMDKGLLSKKSKKPLGTCSAIEGCCDCSVANNNTPIMPEEPNGNPSGIFTEEMEMNREEKDAFENAIQNKVFVPRPEKEQKKDQDGKVRARRQIYKDDLKMDPAIVKEIVAKNETAFNISVVNVADPSFAAEFRMSGRINITGNRMLLTGLPHFTEYVILIYACQDINEPDNSCSARPAWVTIRTAALPENDKVIPDTVHVLNVTNGKENDRRLNWQPPTDPNGIVLAYKVKLFRGDIDTTPLFKCVNRTQFIEEEGITFNGLAGGMYSMELRTVTLAGVGKPIHVKDIFSVYSPIMTKKAMMIVGISILLSLLILGSISYFIFKYYYEKCTESKVRQLLSSNPEYLSQTDVYKKDEWELTRDQLIIGKEIGAGTFGKVFRGLGKDVVSANGTPFGECAIKTISEKDGNMDRLHFLVEASVMKQFNTSYIVKLFGVVSDIPVLVVMELMEKGNLRDFLRAHRPGAEENTESKYSLPTPEQYYNWAGQIADGMAYLESLRFCHRDLAARNCMVHADESVKIGDFGMARDIYYHEYYKPQGRRLMPIRWLSPESLKDGKFTMMSDVWSFGVVLYEMLTLGQQIIVDQLIFSPTSMAVDEGRNSRIYWADPKLHKVDSVLPDGTKRLTVVDDKRLPWAIDVFENHLYWASKETQSLYVQDKFGRGRMYVLASALMDVHSVRVQQRFAKDVARAESACAKAHCSHLCAELPGNRFHCLCPENVTTLMDGSCSGLRIDELPVPKQCQCQNGGKCLLDGSCDCGELEGEFCQKGSTVSRQLIGRLGSGGLFAMLMMFSMLLCLGVLAVLAMTMYKKRVLLFKKNELADGTVSFRGNVISFSNPVLDSHDQKGDPSLHDDDYALSEISVPTSVTTTTTFSNPVYDMDSNADDELHTGGAHPDTPSTSRVSTP